MTTLIKDLSALMFYSSFMKQLYLNYLSALILYVYKLVCACVHNGSTGLSVDVHSFNPAFVILSFVFEFILIVGFFLVLLLLLLL